MSASTSDSGSQTTRRALLAGAAAAAATWTLGAIDPAPAAATTGAMSFGTTNDAGDASTTLTSSTNGYTMNVYNTSSTYGGGILVTVDSGFTGVDVALTPTGPNNSAALRGVNTDTGTGSGVAGASVGGTGVFGYAGSDATVYYLLTYAVATTGVLGYAPTGTGVHAKSDSGTALKVTGKATFSRAKRVTMSAGASSKTITLAGVTSSSMVLATLQSKRTGYYVSSVVPASGKFTIYLNKALTSSTVVAYFVIN